MPSNISAHNSQPVIAKIPIFGFSVTDRKYRKNRSILGRFSVSKKKKKLNFFFINFKLFYVIFFKIWILLFYYCKKIKYYKNLRKKYQIETFNLVWGKPFQCGFLEELTSRLFTDRVWAAGKVKTTISKHFLRCSRVWNDLHRPQIH